jgi:hypothetical protein
MQASTFQVIEGGRHLIEREALYAIFTQPDDFPALLSRLKPACNTHLTSFQNSMSMHGVDGKN